MPLPLVLGKPSPVVAITGAARGIGLATAKLLHASGARLVLGDIDGGPVETAAAALGDRAVGGRLDVADAASFAAFLILADQTFGPVDVLINNAGIMPIGPFLEERSDTAQRAVNVNLVGCLNGMRAVLPGMLGRGGGHIINVASIAGTSPVPGGLTYAATKAAVISATETARVEFAERGVAFTCVLPSFTNTELIAGTQGTRFLKNVEPEEVARAIANAVAKPAPDVYVPKVLRGIAKTTPLMGRTLRDRLNRALKADRAFLDVDQSKRAGYDRRIGTATTPQLSAVPDDE